MTIDKVTKHPKSAKAKWKFYKMILDDDVIKIKCPICYDNDLYKDKSIICEVCKGKRYIYNNKERDIRQLENTYREMSQLINKKNEEQRFLIKRINPIKKDKYGKEYPKIKSDEEKFKLQKEIRENRRDVSIIGETKRELKIYITHLKQDEFIEEHKGGILLDVEDIKRYDKDGKSIKPSRTTIWRDKQEKEEIIKDKIDKGIAKNRTEGLVFWSRHIGELNYENKWKAINQIRDNPTPKQQKLIDSVDGWDKFMKSFRDKRDIKYMMKVEFHLKSQKKEYEDGMERIKKAQKKKKK